MDDDRVHFFAPVSARTEGRDPRPLQLRRLSQQALLRWQPSAAERLNFPPRRNPQHP
jgi:hypothetical protein